MSEDIHHFSVFETRAGFCAIAWSARGIARFQLPTRTADAAERLIRRRLPSAREALPEGKIREAIAAVQRYFSGEPTDFSDLVLDLAGQDPWFTAIYAETRQLAWGETSTYGGLANRLGKGPEAARDIGQAMARNPVPLIIPCHRVLAAGGRIGGFSAPGGAEAKRRMLEIEGVHLAPPAPKQQAFAF